MDQEIARLKELTEKSRAMVFFGGAGVSKESGIPDFRSVDGLYHQAYRYPPETILSRSFYEKNPEEFYRFYRDKMLYLDAEPNPAHKKLAQWEREGRLLAVITQNIDGLHQKAGSRNVLELHGSVHRNYCRRCGKLFDAQYLLRSSGVPRCDQCGGAVKPDVVLYEGRWIRRCFKKLQALSAKRIFLLWAARLSQFIRLPACCVISRAAA